MVCERKAFNMYSKELKYYHNELYRFQMPLKEEVSNFFIFWSTHMFNKRERNKMTIQLTCAADPANVYITSWQAPLGTAFHCLQVVKDSEALKIF